jgi:gliding motility-associated-like protein
MRDTGGYQNNCRTKLFSIFFSLILSLQFSAATGQCDAVIGSNLAVLEGCEVFTVQFYDQSTNVQSRSWDFGDGTPPSNAQNPIRSFNAGTGDTTYIVELTITCASGTSTAQEIVKVFAKPKVDFSTDKLTACAITDSICFDNRSDYHSMNVYTWNFGDGTVSGDLEPCKTYSTPGKYEVSLTVMNEHECRASYIMTDSINVEPVPSTAFSVSSYEGCVPFTISFDNITDTIGNLLSEWTWEFGDGTPDVYEYEAAPHTFTSPGEYTIRLAATNTLGCSNYSTQNITVKPSPVASFMTSAPECQNDFTTVEFTGSYISSPAFMWDFDEPATVMGSGEGPYSIKWSDAGNKDISLTIDDNGCSSLFSEKIEVTPIAKVYLHISASRDTICSGESITFTASPLNFLNYSFYLNSTLVQSSKSNFYESDGFNNGDIIYVKITDANGCSEIISDTVTITVRPTPVVTLGSSLSNDTACINEPVIFTASPAGFDDYLFLINNTEAQTGAGNTYTSSTLANQDRVNVLATHNGCTSLPSNTKKIAIKDALSPPDAYCGTATPNSIQFAWDSVPGATEYQISIDNGPFQTASSGVLGLYHDMGGLPESEEHTIRVKATDSYLCGTEIVSEEVKCAAKNCTAIEFDLDNKNREACENETINLSIDNISIPNYSISWDGDATAATTDYTLPAVSNVVIPVTVTNDDEPVCPAVTKSFVINVTPKVDLELHSSEPGHHICGDEEITFSIFPQNLDQYQLYDNGELIESGTFSSYTVNDIIDGHAYYATATDNACYLISDTVQMTVTEPIDAPVVSFESSTENSVTFSWEPVPGATGYLVSRDDENFVFPSSGNTGLLHTIHSLNPGDAVSLTALALSDGICGNSEISLPAFGYAEICDTIRFNIQNKHSICLGDSVLLKITDLSINNYDIYWGSLPPNRRSTMWIKPPEDTIVRVTVKNRNQPFCAGATKYVAIKVSKRPATLTLSSSDADNVVCFGDQVIFTGAPGGYDTYEFFEYSALVQQGPFNTLTINAMKDFYSFRARAINRECEGEFSNTIETVVEKPLIQPVVNCGNTSETTISFVWDSVPEALNYTVSIDGQPYITASSGADGFIHEMSGLNAGDSATIMVMAMGSTECVTSLPSQQVTCYAQDCGIITFDIDPYHDVCENSDVNLELTNINIPDYSVSWNSEPYGSSTSSVLTATADTTVTVSLRDNNQPVCPTTEKTVVIDVRNTVPVTLTSNAANNTICTGEDLRLEVMPNTFERYVFMEGAVTLQDGINNFFMSTDIQSDLTIKADVYQNGCLTTTNTIATTVITPAAVTLTASESGSACREEEVVFTATPGFDTYQFNNGSFILEETDQNVTGLQINDTEITVTAIDENGCMSVSSDTIKFTIKELPEVLITCSTDTICFGEFASYNAFPEDLVSFTFFRNIDPVQSSAGSFFSTDLLREGDVVSVVGTDADGCSSKPITSSYPVILPYPDYTIGARADGVCLSDSVEIFLETAGKDPKYSFYWSTGETADTITIRPTTTANFSLYYSDGICNNIRIDSKTIEVDRETPPIAYAGEDVIICIGDSIMLEAEGGRTAVWSPATGLDNPESYTPWAGPPDTTMYTVTVTNSYCKSQDSVLVIIDLCLEGLTKPVPQIISPNGDNINDYWEIEHIDYFQGNSLKIFNRWGNEVYSASPYLNGWHGQSNKGIDLPDGTYYYILKLGNGTEEETGYVIIHR